MTARLPDAPAPVPVSEGGPRFAEPMLVAMRDPATDRFVLEWAAERAASLRVPLTLLHAVADPSLFPPGGSFGDAVIAGRELIAREAQRIVRRHDGLQIGTYLHCGDVVEALLGLAASSPLIVVGADRKDPARDEFKGSVAVQVALNSTAPVVVVPPHQDAEAAAGQNRGGVVVGVDGSEVSHDALSRAGEEARLMMTTLTVVTALGSRPERMTVSASTMLQQVRERYPELPVNWIVDDIRSPVQALRHHGTGSDLLVIGRHGSGARAGMSLGSVTHTLLLEPPSPTLVLTRHEPEPPAAAAPGPGQGGTPGR